MAYISPNSTVKLLRGIPFDRGYNHTKNFWGTDSTYTQYYYFNDFTKMSFTQQSYQRVNKDTIRLAVLADNIYDCNYMMFQNTAYGSKWFYAFIDKIDYINDNCTELTYTIDVLQTWFFDYDLRACYVEREHSITDVIGDNIVPENFNVGDKLEVSRTDYTFPYLLGGIVATKPFPSFTVSSSAVPIKTMYFPRYTTTGTPDTEAPCGVPNGIFIAIGFPLTEEDCINYWNSQYRYYDLQDYNPSTDFYITLGKYLETTYNYTTSLQSTDDVVCVFTYPAFGSEYQAQLNAENVRGYRKGMATEFYTLNNNRPSAFYDISSNGTITNPFVPKNNKLFTSPYVDCMVTNISGDSIIFKYENFGNGVPSFDFTTSNIYNSTVVCTPNNYLGEQVNYNYNLIIGDFPAPSFKSSQFSKWLESNNASFAYGLMSTAISGLGHAQVSEYSAHLFPARPTAGKHYKKEPFTEPAQMQTIDTGLSIGGSLANAVDAMNAPPTAVGNFNASLFNSGTNHIGFQIFARGIKREYAERIDDYFTMFGYATKKCKIPNIMNRSSGSKIRNNFMYTKTIGSIITPKSGTGLPADDIEKLQTIYDKGVTFWRNASVCGDYTVDNSIITI